MLASPRCDTSKESNMTLPQYIADLCGILESAPVTIGRGQNKSPESPLQTVTNADGSRTVTYFGREIGHMTRAKMPDRNAQHWIAVTTNGDVKRCFSETHARTWIVENTY